MVLNAIPECDLIDITGGGFLDGAALVISSLSVAVKVVSIAAASTAAAPLSAGASVALGAALIMAEFGFAVGLAEMCGANL